MVMKRACGVETMLLINVFINCRSAVGVVRLPMNGILLPPTVRRMRVDSVLRGQSESTR